ncbi:MAG: hypothetical protein ACHQIM_01805 [Sphingobacteriales bacterium]
MKPKPLIIICLFLIFRLSNAYAQNATELDFMLKSQKTLEATGTPAKDIVKLLGSNVYVRDTVSEIKAINDSLTFLYIGGKYPKHQLTIIVKGEKLNKQTSSWWKNGIGHFSGVAILYEGKPAIVIVSQWQLGTVIQI